MRQRRPTTVRSARLQPVIAQRAGPGEGEGASHLTETHSRENITVRVTLGLITDSHTVTYISMFNRIFYQNETTVVENCIEK